MVHKNCLTFCLLFFTQLLHAQSTFKKNDIYLEAGGHGLFGSVNYERQLTKSPGLGVRMGLGFYTENAFYLTIPAGINYLFKLPGNNSFIDAGIGGSWTKMDGRLFGDVRRMHWMKTSLILYRVLVTEGIRLRTSCGA